MRYPRTVWRPSLAVAMATVVLPSMTAVAQDLLRQEYTPERIAFDAADTDGDGRVTLPELARDAAHGFAVLDKDGDGRLKPGDLDAHDPALFRQVDTNGDGVLTFEEVMANKSRAFKEGDVDEDVGLSFEEMMDVVERETGGAS